jgi:hypothetical protein
MSGRHIEFLAIFSALTTLLVPRLTAADDTGCSDLLRTGQIRSLPKNQGGIGTLADQLRGKSGEGSCDKSNPPVCCNDWVVDIANSRDPKSRGGVSPYKPTYERTIKAVENAQIVDDMLCKGFGRSESACYNTYGPPHCVGGPANTDGAVSKDAIDKIVDEIDFGQKAAEKAIFGESVTAAQLRGLGTGAETFIRNIKAENPFAALGDGVAGYAGNLKDVFNKLGCLRQAFKELPPIPSLDDNSSFGGIGIYHKSSGGAFGTPDPQQPLPIPPARKLVEKERAETVALGSALDSIHRAITEVEIAESPDKITVTRRGTATIILGSEEITDHARLSAGTQPVVMLCASGKHQVVLAPVEKTQHETPTGTDIILSGTSPACKVSATLHYRALDSDHDGIPDREDECPTEKGIRRYKGCPPPKDRDHDGIVDSEDECPDQRGLREYRGCPGPRDRDGDGVADNEDVCPDEKGPASNRGCPIKPTTTQPPASNGPILLGRCGEVAARMVPRNDYGEDIRGRYRNEDWDQNCGLNNPGSTVCRAYDCEHSNFPITKLPGFVGQGNLPLGFIPRRWEPDGPQCVVAACFSQ